VVELRRDASLVQEHLDELGLLREVREDALDDDELRALGLLGKKELRHPADRESLDEEVLAERRGCLRRGRGNGSRPGEVGLRRNLPYCHPNGTAPPRKSGKGRLQGESPEKTVD
jgi:hypothetical protein